MNDEITGKTKLTALLGSPVAHSLSPLMHNEAFRLLGLDYVYLAFDICEKQLSETIEGLKALDIQGFNLTMPLKTAILPLLDELTPAARLSGSVNTVINQNGKLIGHTTDGTGYMRSVLEEGYNIIGKKMTLLGAGGAATAICVQAALDGVASIDMFKRNNASWQNTEAFCQNIQAETGCLVTLYDITDARQLRSSIAQSKLLTNATNVGMEPDTSNCIITDFSMLFPDLVVSDIIYHPRETKLLKQAREIGCFCFNGQYMLLYQGASAFHCWTGQNMPVEIIKKKYFT